MKIIVCPDSFKGTCTASAAAAAIARGVKAALPDVELVLLPLADGGEGTVATLCSDARQRRWGEVHDPLMRKRRAEWGVIEGETAVIEVAAAAGLTLLAPHERDPLRTTTYGVGELIVAALAAGYRRIVIGLGGSATNDGGVGMAQALGYRFLDPQGRVLPLGVTGGQLGLVARIDADGVIPALWESEVKAACDVRNPLCGPEGAAAVFAPQKGARAEDVPVLDAGLAHLAQVMARDLGIDVKDVPGAGAAGGLGAGCLAFMRAQLVPGIELILDALHFEEHLVGASLVITGEGRVDAQSGMGKVLSGVVRRARRAKVPVIALAGSVDERAELPCRAYGIVNAGVPVEDACRNVEEHLARLAATVMRELWPDMARG